MNRRALLRTTALALPFVVMGCTAGALQTIAAQVLADVQGLVPAAKNIVAQVQLIDPAAVTPSVATNVQTWLAAATSMLTNLSASTPAATGASNTQIIVSNLNNVFNAIGPILTVAAMVFPALAPVIPIYDAAVGLLPGVENWIESVLPTAAATPGRANTGPTVPAAIGTGYQPPAARAILGIPTV